MISSPANTELTQLSHLITEFYDKMSAWEQTAVRETGYSLAQIHTIEALGHFGAMRMTALAKRLGITTGTLTVQVDKLVQAQLIERLAHPEDGRVTLVQLTALGQDLHQQHHQLHLALIARLTTALTPEQISVLVGSFQHINHAFDLA